MKMKVDNLGLPTEKDDVLAALHSTISLIPHTSHRGKALHLLTKLSESGGGGAGVPVHEAGDPSAMPVNVFNTLSNKPNSPSDLATYKGFQCQNDTECAAYLIPSQNVVGTNQTARDTFREGNQLFEMTLSVVGTKMYMTTVPLVRSKENQHNQTKTTLVDAAVPEGAIPYMYCGDDVTLNNSRGEIYGYVAYNSTTKKIKAKVWEIQTAYGDVGGDTSHYSYTFADESLDLETPDYAIGDIKVALGGTRQIIIAVDINADGQQAVRSDEGIHKVVVFTCARYFGGGESPAVYTYDLTGGYAKTHLVGSTTNLWAGLITVKDDRTNPKLYELTPYGWTGTGADANGFAKGTTHTLQFPCTFDARVALLTRKGTTETSNHVLTLVDPEFWYVGSKWDDAVGTFQLTIKDDAESVMVQQDTYKRTDLDPDLKYLAPVPESHWYINMAIPAFMRLFPIVGGGSTECLLMDGVNPHMSKSSVTVLPLSAPMLEMLQQSPFNYVEARYSNNQNVYHIVRKPTIDPTTRKGQVLATQFPMTGGTGWTWFSAFTKNDAADPSTVTTELTGYLTTVDMGGHFLESDPENGSPTQMPIIHGSGVFFADHLGVGLDDDAPVGTQVLLVRRKNCRGHDRQYRSDYPDMSGAFVVALSSTNPDNVRVIDCIRNVNNHPSYRGALFCEKKETGWVTQNLI